MLQILTPTTLIRMGSELVLLIVALTVVIRTDRRAGLFVAFGAGSALVGGLLAPLTEAGLFYAQSQKLDSDPGLGSVWPILGMVFVGWMVPLVQSLEIGLVIAGLVRLCRRVPPEARERPAGSGWRAS